MKLYRRYVEWVFTHRWHALIACFAILVGATVLASDIKLKSDLQRLLPDAAPSVQGLQLLETEYGDQLGRLTIVLTGDIEARKRISSPLLKELGKLPDVDRAVSNPVFALKDYRLLYVELDELQKAQTQIKKRIKWEKQRANPLFVSLKKENPPEVELESKSSDGELAEFYETELKTFLFVHPTFPASDLDRTRLLVSNVEKNVQATLPDSVDYAFTGRYAKRILQQELITKDVASASSIALLLLVLFLGIFFRSPRFTILAIVPLIAGTLLTGAVVVLTFGSLNIITGFLAAVIMGLGVDYGIHFCAALRKGTEQDLKSRWLAVLNTTGRANIYAGVTTAVAFGFLSVSSFRAFFEFGIIAFVGLLFVVGCYFLMTPILISTVGLPPAGDSNQETSKLGFSARSFSISVGLVAASVVAIGFGIFDVHFDRSFDYLQITDTPMHRLDQEVNDVLGVSQTPAVLLADDAEHEKLLIAELEQRKETTSVIGEIIHGGRFVPVDLEARRNVIRDILKEVDTLPRRVELTADLNALIAEARETVDKPLSKSTLPKSLTTPLSRRSNGSVILVMPNGDLGEAAASAKFAKSIRDLPGSSSDAPTISALSEVQLLTEIMDMVQADIGKVVALNIFAIFLIAFVALRFRNWIRFAVNTTVSMTVALALLALFDIPLNFMNSLVLPVCIGLAVDASFHMFAQIETNPENDAQHRKTMVALVGSFATSMIGFGSLVVTVHPGLRSLGYSAIVALLAIAITNIALYRIWLRWER